MAYVDTCKACGKHNEWAGHRTRNGLCDKCFGIACAESSMEFNRDRNPERYADALSKKKAWESVCPICNASAKDVVYDVKRQAWMASFHCNCATFFDSGTLSDRVQKSL